MGFVYFILLWDVLNELAGMSPENQSFKVVRVIESDLGQQKLPPQMGSKKSFHSA